MLPVGTARASWALLLLGASTFASACELPPLVAIPEAEIGDGVADLLRDMRTYTDRMVEYTKCIQTDLEAAGGKAAPAAYVNVLVRRNNAAVAELKAVTDLFTERVAPLGQLQLAEFLGAQSESCLVIAHIDRTAVVSEHAVLFLARSGSGHLSVLESACDGLEQAGTFNFFPAHAVPSVFNFGQGREPLPTGSVCSSDHVYPYSVVRNQTSVRIGCALGPFFPISEEQATRLLAAREPAESPADERPRGRRGE
jgi:hypothetical protein